MKHIRNTENNFNKFNLKKMILFLFALFPSSESANQEMRETEMGEEEIANKIKELVNVTIEKFRKKMQFDIVYLTLEFGRLPLTKGGPEGMNDRFFTPMTKHLTNNNNPILAEQISSIEDQVSKVLDSKSSFSNKYKNEKETTNLLLRQIVDAIHHNEEIQKKITKKEEEVIKYIITSLVTPCPVIKELMKMKKLKQNEDIFITEALLLLEFAVHEKIRETKTDNIYDIQPNIKAVRSIISRAYEKGRISKGSGLNIITGIERKLHEKGIAGIKQAKSPYKAEIIAEKILLYLYGWYETDNFSEEIDELNFPNAQRVIKTLLEKISKQITINNLPPCSIVRHITTIMTMLLINVLPYLSENELEVMVQKCMVIIEGGLRPQLEGAIKQLEVETIKKIRTNEWFIVFSPTQSTTKRLPAETIDKIEKLANVTTELHRKNLKGPGFLIEAQETKQGTKAVQKELGKLYCAYITYQILATMANRKNILIKARFLPAIIEATTTTEGQELLKLLNSQKENDTEQIKKQIQDKIYTTAKKIAEQHPGIFFIPMLLKRISEVLDLLIIIKKEENNEITKRTERALVIIQQEIDWAQKVVEENKITEVREQVKSNIEFALAVLNKLAVLNPDRRFLYQNNITQPINAIEEMIDRLVEEEKKVMEITLKTKCIDEAIAAAKEGIDNILHMVEKVQQMCLIAFLFKRAIKPTEKLLQDILEQLITKTIQDIQAATSPLIETVVKKAINLLDDLFIPFAAFANKNEITKSMIDKRQEKIQEKKNEIQEVANKRIKELKNAAMTEKEEKMIEKTEDREQIENIIENQEVKIEEEKEEKSRSNDRNYRNI